MCDRSSGHDQMECRVAQRAIQLYDVNHSRKAGDVYKKHQMDLEDWRINMQRVAVLQPITDGTQYLQGTKYPPRPTDDVAAASVQPAQAVPAVNEQPTKKRKVMLGTLLGRSVKKEPASTPKPEEMEDELEQDLDDSEEPNLDIKVLDWWQLKESKCEDGEANVRRTHFICRS
ncbi:MAG: hypothetical protein SGPRY_008108 [Prymnesium sp.]